ncbi:MAG: SufS family cysteine desulfurase [Nanoarchaeota archaeon]|nr:SufS family cysteine desulfurase [Nanoarchaeota archaeon]
MNITKDFPLLQRKINKKNIIYLDNAATTQKPKQVLQAMQDYYEHHNANIHRGIHTLGEEATEDYEQARMTAADFLQTTPEEIIFTSGTTASINLAARSYLATLPKKSEILVSAMEHHSNYVPWQQLSKQYGLIFKELLLTPEGTITETLLRKHLTKKTKILAISHASNVTGHLNDIKTFTKIIHETGAVISVDGAQAAPHLPLDMKKLDVDFYSCSGHKLYGPTGIGILYGKKEHLETMEPITYGGGMIKTVSKEKTTWNDLPAKYEAGTPNIAGALGLAAALDYLKKQGMENIARQGQQLTQQANKLLSDVTGLTKYGTANLPIISFNLNKIHAHDVATALNTENIMVRAGNHCAMPLMKYFKVNGTVRASFGIYNTVKDIQALATALEKTQEFFVP